MKKLIKYLYLAVLPVTVLLVSGCTNPQSLDFQYKSPKDTVLKYDLKSNTSESGTVTNLIDKKSKNLKNDSSTSITITEKTKEVSENGDRLVEYTLTNMKISATRDGKTQDIPIPQMDGQKINLKISKNGKVLEREGTEIDPKENPQDLFMPTLPTETKKIGDTWTDKNENKSPALPGINIIMKSEIVNKFAGYETFNGANCAKIEQTLKISQNIEKDPKIAKSDALNMDVKVTGNGSGYILYDYKRGVVVKSEQNISSTIYDKRSDSKSKLANETQIKSENKRSMVLSEEPASENKAEGEKSEAKTPAAEPSK